MALISKTSPNISLKNVSFSYPSIAIQSRSLKNRFIFKKKFYSGIYVANVLESLSLGITPGDRVGLIGPNGSGKSTFLRLVAGVYQPTSGLLTTRGRILSLLDISYGHEGELSGFEFIELRLHLNGINRISRTLIESIIEFSGLEQYIYHPLRTYSSGMFMRLCFSIVTSISAEILLLDEWLSVGDVEFSERANKKLNSMIQDTPILILASHNMELISKVTNKQIDLGKKDFLKK